MIDWGDEIKVDVTKVHVVGGAWSGRKGRIVSPPKPIRYPFGVLETKVAYSELVDRQEHYFKTKYGTGFWVDLFQEGDPETADLFGMECNIRGGYIRYFARDELEVVT